MPADRCVRFEVKLGRQHTGMDQMDSGTLQRGGCSENETAI